MPFEGDESLKDEIIRAALYGVLKNTYTTLFIFYFQIGFSYLDPNNNKISLNAAAGLAFADYAFV